MHQNIEILPLGSDGIHVWHTQTKKTSTDGPHLMVFPKNHTVIDLREKDGNPNGPKVHPRKNNEKLTTHHENRKDEKSSDEVSKRSKRERQDDFKQQLRSLSTKQMLEVIEFLKYKTEKQVKILHNKSTKALQHRHSNLYKIESVDGSSGFLDSLGTQ